MYKNGRRVEKDQFAEKFMVLLILGGILGLGVVSFLVLRPGEKKKGRKGVKGKKEREMLRKDAESVGFMSRRSEVSEGNYIAQEDGF